MTGKSLDMNANSKYDSSSLSNCLLEKTGIEHMSREGDAVANAYRHFYFRNPCVPIDFETISEALKRCPRTPSRLIFNHGDDTNTFYSRVGTVVLMPGVYRDRIHIDGEPWAVGQSIKAVAIRASFPAIGAALMHYHCPLQDGSCEVDQTIETQQNQSCITISTRDADDLGGTPKGIAVRLSHLAILHATPGVSKNGA